MPVALGTGGKVAIVKGSTWGTAVSLGTGHRVPFKTSGVDYQRDQIENDDLNESGLRESSHLGNAYVDGPLVINGDYHQLTHMILAAMMMGAAGSPTESPTGVYTHVMPFARTNDGLFVSYGVDWGGADVYGYDSVKVASRSVAISSAGRMEETYQFMGAGVDKTIASTGWTYDTDPTDGNTLRVLHRHNTMRVNASAGGALGSSDVVRPTNIQIDFNRAMASDFAAAGEPDEPSPDGFAAIDVTLTFFGMTAALLALFRDAKDDGTALKSDLVLDYGVVIPTTAVNYSRAFYFPKLKVVECPNSIDGPGKLPFTVKMTAHQAASDPTGFPTGYDEACTEVWVNDEDGDPLA